ncbi:MAG: hypothetical protein JWM99_769 [Verrucomicrobiales bacterium]|nr:hypothetical protein [Verrucomicrobiales bacterium]
MPGAGIFFEMQSMSSEQLAVWREQYRETHEALETVRAQELSVMSNADGLRILQSLSGVETWRERSDWSGLVEQQALFMKASRS